MKRISVYEDTKSNKVISLMEEDKVVFSHPINYEYDYEIPQACLDLINEDLGNRVLSSYKELFSDNKELGLSLEAEFAMSSLYNSSSIGMYEVIAAALNEEEMWFIDYIDALEWYQYDVAIGDFTDTIAQELFGYGIAEIHRTLEFPYPVLNIKYSKYADLAFFTLDNELVGTIKYSSNDASFLPEAIQRYIKDNKIVSEVYYGVLYDLLEDNTNLSLLDLDNYSPCDYQDIYTEYLLKLNEHKQELFVEFLKECRDMEYALKLN